MIRINDFVTKHFEQKDFSLRQPLRRVNKAVMNSRDNYRSIVYMYNIFNLITFSYNIVHSCPSKTIQYIHTYS